MEHPRRDGRFMVVSPATSAEERCVICNSDRQPLGTTRRISTLSPWYPLFSSAGWNAHCADDLPIHIPYCLCLRHRLEAYAHVALILGFWASNLLMVADLSGGFAFSPAVDFFAAVAPLPLVGILWLGRPTLRPRRVKGGLAWLSGAGAEFLESLPPYVEKNARGANHYDSPDQIAA